MKKNINTPKIKNIFKRKNTNTQDEIADKKINLTDILSLVNKLEEPWKQAFMVNLSQQKNISPNVFNLLLSHADSQILYNLCENSDLSWDTLEKLVQKLIWIIQGTEQVPLVDDEQEYFDTDEDENTIYTDKPINYVQDVSYLLEFLFKNSNLTTQQIENIMIFFNGYMNHRFQINVCSHPNTSSWILEKIYEINPDNMKDLIFAHPNLSLEFREKIKSIIIEKQEENENKKEVESIIQKHPELDIYKILKYYENKQDHETCKIVAEYLYNDKLWNFRYGAKQEYENLRFKLNLAVKYDMWEERKLKVIYSMLGDTMVKNGTLEIFEYIEEPIYWNISDIEAKYWVQISQEKIKTVCQEILEEMTWWCMPPIDEVENIYQMAQDLEIEIPVNVQKYYIRKGIGEIERKKLGRSSRNMDHFEFLYYFQKSLQFIVSNKNMFSEEELVKYVSIIDADLSFPLKNIYTNLMNINNRYSWSTKLFDNAKKNWFKDIMLLEWRDIFDLIDKLELWEKFKHNMAVQKFKKYLPYRHHDDWKNLIKKFTIERSELIDLIINYQWNNFNWRGFAMRWQYSLEECLEKYWISADEVVPSLLPKIKEQLVDEIKKWDYADAQIIVDKYNLSTNPEFQDQIDLLKTLTM